jgi:4-amino-4-deoxy-L-arabinose transferase-like glycosyltransferase
MRFYYRGLRILGGFIVFPPAVLYLLVDSTPSTYLRFLQVYPGRLIIWAMSIYIAAMLWSRLPILVRWLFRIPAVEADGARLIVRGWSDKIFDLTGKSEISITEDEDRGDLWVRSSGGLKARIHLRDIEGPRSLVRFLRTFENGTGFGAKI